jgi:hypothetical protein
MDIDECLAHACELVPGLLHGALALLPEGYLIGSLGAGGAFSREPLVRFAARCFKGFDGGPSASARKTSFVEHVLVGREELVTLSQSARYPRLALVIVCSSEPNLAFVIAGSRQALRRLEDGVDLEAWEL